MTQSGQRQTNNHLTHPNYRPDIDGLRAIAVLSVVIFHAFPNLLKGGFIGVDIFFVISGYLISTIIYQNLESGSFSFSEFYFRRIKRIFPALLLVLIFSFGFGWFVLFADEYKQLGKHIAAGAGFVSNFALWGESGYFDASADTKPLLHLWSLGIEEQFYIAWPLLLWLARKRKFNFLTTTILFAAVSFILNVQGVRQDAISTFYLPQTRFWELLSGSLLAWLTIYHKQDLHKTAPAALLRLAARLRLAVRLHCLRLCALLEQFCVSPDKKTFLNARARLSNWPGAMIDQHHLVSKAKEKILADMLAFVGLSIICYGIWHIKKDFIFPGVWALVPVVGTVMLISAGPDAWINRTILSNRLAVWFGLISFPLYLWHWPLLSFARIVESEFPEIKIRAGAVLLSILLSWLTYKFVEKPVRSDKYSKVKVLILVLAMFVVGYIGYNTYTRDGLSFRMKDREEFTNYYENSFPTWKYFNKINLFTEWRNECAFFDGERYLKEGKIEGDVINSKPVSSLNSGCYIRDVKFEKSVMIWGDSHAQALAPGITRFMPKNWQVLQVASSGCLPDPNILEPSSTNQCNETNYFAIKTIETAKPDVVVVAQAFGHSIKNIEQIKRKLGELGVKKILFIGPTPRWTSHLPKIIARRLWLTKPRRTFVGLNQNNLNVNKELVRQFQETKTAHFVDIAKLFCNEDGCLTYTGDDMKSSVTSWDLGHLTPSASIYLAKNLLIREITLE